jgi:hypothetical protein
VIAKPWKQISSVTLRAAIVTEGTRPKVVRFVTYNVMADRYAIYIAKRGQCAKRLATGCGTPDAALLHACADNQFLNMPGVPKRRHERMVGLA